MYGFDEIIRCSCGLQILTQGFDVGFDGFFGGGILERTNAIDDTRPTHDPSPIAHQ